MTITQWHVPIDDENCYWYAISRVSAGRSKKKQMRRHRLELYTLPDYNPQDQAATTTASTRTSSRRQTYTGMGDDINVHDQWAVESQGPIQDRTRSISARDKASWLPPDARRCNPDGSEAARGR